ncbi:MAG: tRNA uridine-5-carboxymethylaminomethyl(34) synthesis GTPase MnmE [Trichloromonas sp.]|jgi:tRNA modification GTPase|nr:tRNA uridine-5-carboxymethylaminomethyl(34) synthesis GTPase MnmE [Trichloromonas sp.]
METIVAVATAPGEGAIGIVRLSGPCAEVYLDQLFCALRPPAKLLSHRLYLGHLRAVGGQIIDEVMVVVMRAPHSFTREDVVEVHCHGGMVIIRQIVDAFLEVGARLAGPGEFTQRAFLNGRLDLSQAEAVIDLIRARSESAGRVALAQLDGRVSRTIAEMSDRLADLLSHVESLVDFPEEDIEFAELSFFEEEADNLLGRIDNFLENFDMGRILREGLSVLILGKPNVGKSSLLNLLLGEARAIVTDIPGTTRDTIEETLVLGGIPLRLIDTAGVRDTDDPVEAEGVARARAKAASADLILLVIDSSRPLDEQDRLAFNACRDQKTLLVCNKADLSQIPLPSEVIHVPNVFLSCRTGEGLPVLRDSIVSLLGGSVQGDLAQDVIFSDRRHRDALLRTREALIRFQSAMAAGLSPEFPALELREALDALGEILGKTTPDNILDRIFSRFCIGK